MIECVFCGRDTDRVVLAETDELAGDMCPSCFRDYFLFHDMEQA